MPKVNISKQAKEMLTWYGTYLDLGFSRLNIVLLKPNSKKPLGILQEWPDKILSLVSGEAQLGLIMIGDLFCLDFDNEEIYQKWRANNPSLKSTATSKTSTGYHVLFRVADLDNAPPSGKSKDVSIISDNWYIAVFPSIHPDGTQYRWITPPVRSNIFTVHDVFVTLNGINVDEIEWNVPDYGDEDDPYIWD